ncbi:accessory Sec system glycosylation chaperone GtfB [Staphylococcus lutrae]|uniref:UDP-N-acetylglucosamine--peptide N-acetylglucosaminyltransferase stabilizing protein GtfB n=1 Tax=Staphylococcus lutrae TaxID=155085 RepID=A0AAC9RVT0_9STAP|nr:accessory Sec system glycosylation chaperone GtfB [Staphylococcus lutrae]ARJ50752.1 accessory Sec system glycosylation chaperone GtfB [Staphylococcus lutrae]PNZ37857.1 accessory Sec system glycosylation chaperone GtfB [Staphylococcus lutrae]
MVNLFEHFDTQTQALYQSLQLAGKKDLTIVLMDDGFLPEEIVTPYQFFSNYQAPDSPPRYFNEVSVPRYWEIEGDNEVAWIKDMGYRRGQIHYYPSEKRRLVSHVEWLDQHEKLQFVDYYTQHGVRFAQAVYDLRGVLIFRRYFDQEGKDVIYHNFLAGSVILNWQGQQYHFDSLLKFYQFFLEALEIDLSHFVINSLSVPFSLLYYLDHAGDDTLYWQEQCHGDIPGNMRLILDKTMTERQFSIIVTDNEEYRDIVGALTESERERVYQGGYIYHYASTNQYQPNVLTMTNTDQIHHLASIVEALPFATFHVGAVTEMSTKLTQLERYPNVRLYQAIELDTVEKLYQKCDIYLDINEAGEIINAVEKAFMYDMLILGYEETAHNRLYTAPQNLFSKDNEAADLKQALRDIHLKKRYFKVRQHYQKVHANEVSVDTFNEIHARAHQGEV